MMQCISEHVNSRLQIRSKKCTPELASSQGHFSMLHTEKMGRPGRQYLARAIAHDDMEMNEVLMFTDSTIQLANSFLADLSSKNSLITVVRQGTTLFSSRSVEAILELYIV